MRSRTIQRPEHRTFLPTLLGFQSKIFLPTFLFSLSLSLPAHYLPLTVSPLVHHPPSSRLLSFAELGRFLHPIGQPGH